MFENEHWGYAITSVFASNMQMLPGATPGITCNPTLPDRTACPCDTDI